MRSTPARSAAVRKFSASALLRVHPVGAFADAVHEEDGDVDVGHRFRQVATDVGPHHLDLVTPTRGVELPQRRAPRSAPDDLVPTAR